MVQSLSLLTILLGHACLTVLAVNFISGVGIRERWMGGARLALVLVFGLATLVACGIAWNGDWATWPGWFQGYASLCLLLALVGLPMVTITRSLRRLPLGIQGRSESTDLARTHGAEALIGVGKDALWLRMPGNQAFQPCLTEWNIEVVPLPESLDGFSVLHLTDLHLTPSYSRRFFEALAETYSGVDVDLVLFTGDLIDDERALEWVEPILSRFRGRFGQFAVLGNHDYRRDVRGPIDALQCAGFEVLEGRWKAIPVEGATIALGGTSFPWGPRLDPIAMPEGDLRLLMSHSPDLFYLASKWGIDLMLSGHTHGGQYRLPILGPVLLPSRYSRRFDHGFFREGRTLLYVSRGIAAQHPLRWNCPPEITRFTLHPAPLPAPHRTNRRAKASV